MRSPCATREEPACSSRGRQIIMMNKGMVFRSKFFKDTDPLPWSPLLQSDFYHINLDPDGTWLCFTLEAGYLSDFSLSEASLVCPSQAPSHAVFISLPPSCGEIPAGLYLEPATIGTERVTMETLNFITPMSLWQTRALFWNLLC